MSSFIDSEIVPIPLQRPEESNIIPMADDDLLALPSDSHQVHAEGHLMRTNLPRDQYEMMGTKGIIRIDNEEENQPVTSRNYEPFCKNALNKVFEPSSSKQSIQSSGEYISPPLNLLTVPNKAKRINMADEDVQRANKIIEILASFSIPASLNDIIHGPAVTYFEFLLVEGINVSRMSRIIDILRIDLKAKGPIRAEIPIPGTSCIGLEVPNVKVSTVYLHDVLNSMMMQESKSPTAVALGKDINGEPIVFELTDMLHLLIAGATGSGKSMCIHSIICSILYRASPRQVRMILVDTKMVELQPYNGVPHLLMPVITDKEETVSALEWVCRKTDERLQVLERAGVHNLDTYNRKLRADEEPLPCIIVIVDEMTDMMTANGKLIEYYIKHIAAKAHAVGVCLILTTQRFSANIITETIMANIHSRIVLGVNSTLDSKIIFGEQGAEKLLGYGGDFLYRPTKQTSIRLLGCFVSGKDVEQTVEYISRFHKTEYDPELMEHVIAKQDVNRINFETSNLPDSELY